MYSAHLSLIVSLFCFVVLALEPRAHGFLGKLSTTDLYHTVLICSLYEQWEDLNLLDIFRSVC